MTNNRGGIPNDEGSAVFPAGDTKQAALDAVWWKILGAGLVGTGILSGGEVTQHGSGGLQVVSLPALVSVLGQGAAVVGDPALAIGANTSNPPKPRFDLIVDRAGISTVIPGAVAADGQEPCWPMPAFDADGELTDVVRAAVMVHPGVADILDEHIILLGVAPAQSGESSRGVRPAVELTRLPSSVHTATGWNGASQIARDTRVTDIDANGDTWEYIVVWGSTTYNGTAHALLWYRRCPDGQWRYINVGGISGNPLNDPVTSVTTADGHNSIVLGITRSLNGTKRRFHIAANMHIAAMHLVYSNEWTTPDELATNGATGWNTVGAKMTHAGAVAANNSWTYPEMVRCADADPTKDTTLFFCRYGQSGDGDTFAARWNPALASGTGAWESPSGSSTHGSWAKIVSIETIDGTADAASDLITIVKHQFVAGDTLTFPTAVGGLSTSATYYVIASGLTADAFKVSTTAGGAAFNITASGAVVVNPAINESIYPPVICPDVNGDLHFAGIFRRMLLNTPETAYAPTANGQSDPSYMKLTGCKCGSTIGAEDSAGDTITLPARHWYGDGTWNATTGAVTGGNVLNRPSTAGVSPFMELVADTWLPVHVFDPGTGLFYGDIGVDTDGYPHLLQYMYDCDMPSENLAGFYGVMPRTDPADRTLPSNIVHFWRDAVSWHYERVTSFMARRDLTGVGGSLLENHKIIAAPSIVCSEQGRVFVAHRETFGQQQNYLHLLEITPGAAKRDAVVLGMNLTDFEPSVDHRALLLRNELSMLVFIGANGMSHNTGLTWTADTNAMTADGQKQDCYDSQFCATLTVRLDQIDDLLLGRVNLPRIESVRNANAPVGTTTDTSVPGFSNADVDVIGNRHKITATNADVVSDTGEAIVTPSLDIAGDHFGALLFARLVCTANRGTADEINIAIQQRITGGGVTRLATLRRTDSGALRMATPWVPLFAFEFEDYDSSAYVNVIKTGALQVVCWQVGGVGYLYSATLELAKLVGDATYLAVA